MTASSKLIRKFAPFMRDYRAFHKANIMSGKQLNYLRILGLEVDDHAITTAKATLLINEAKARARAKTWREDNVQDFLD